jgi:7-cyano-7-deazaguanine synthase
LFWAKKTFAKISAVTIDYGQRHSRELDAAREVARMAGVESHEVIPLPGILKGTSPLVSGQSLETYSSFTEMDRTIGDRVELTFVPVRNPFFLTLAANRAVCLGANSLVTGICQADNANYPDCRESFREAMANALREALGDPMFYLFAPLMNMTKAESIRFAKTLPGCYEALAYSHTAYSGEYPPVTQDHATVLRAEGFRQADTPDPLIFRAWLEGAQEILPDEPAYARCADVRTIRDLAVRVGAELG